MVCLDDVNDDATGFFSVFYAENDESGRSDVCKRFAEHGEAPDSCGNPLIKHI